MSGSGDDPSSEAYAEARRKSAFSYEQFKKLLAEDDKPKIAIVYYSLYGHVTTLAESVKAGIEEGGNATCDIYRVEETLPEEVLMKMHAPPKNEDHPVMTADRMGDYDGFVFGLSGRFGAMPAQMKAFMDSCGGLWQKGALVGKAAGTFVSVGTMGGGQETVHMSMLSFFAHMGMAYVPMGYTDPKAFSMEEIHGGTPWGSGTYAGPDGSRMPSDLEKGLAVSHGRHFAGIAAKLSAKVTESEAPKQDAEAMAKAAAEARRKSTISYEQFKAFLESEHDVDDEEGEGGAPKIAIIYYSLYGHVAGMAEKIKEGVESAGGTCAIFRVEETLPPEVLEKMGAPPKADHPLMTANNMEEYDGFIFGMSGRFGAMPAQMKAFMDSCGGLWQKGALVGKSAGSFVSVGTMGGGQEMVHISAASFFAHMGMAFVPLGYVEPKMFSMEEIHGGTPWGSGTYAGPDGSRMPTDLEKDIAVSHGKHFTGITKKLSTTK